MLNGSQSGPVTAANHSNIPISPPALRSQTETATANQSVGGNTHSSAAAKSNRSSLTSLTSASYTATVETHDPVEMFLKSAIERILADPSIKKKEHAQLKKACETALGNSFRSTSLPNNTLNI